MARIHTHYDNLKVARDAPMEVIHAAYRSLAAMYHPDRNGGSEEAARIMRIINSSYVALCDPVRKREHDRWIDSVASDAIPEAPPPPRESNIGPPAEPTRKRAPVINLPPQPTGVRKHWMWLVAGGIFASLIMFGIFFGGMPDNTTPTVPAAGKVARPTAPPVESTPNQPAPTATSPPPEPSPQSNGFVASLRRLTHMYIRPELDPYGQPWPAASGYLTGFEQSRMEGLTTITVDNGKINSDMLVKLYVRVGPRPAAVRVLFLKARNRFKMEAITAGPYDLRYQDLDSGVIFRSDPLELTETEEPDGIAYFNRTVSLYTAIDGTLKREQIGPEDFR